MNASELRKALELQDNHEIMILMMSDKHQAEGWQFHRELTRLLHNYLAGSMTLVDHTRVFVDENYPLSEIRRTFKTRIDLTFKNNPLTRFIQDLRNYIVHRGLPPTSCRLTMKRDPKTEETIMTADTVLNVKTLRQWSGWKADSRMFLDNQGEEIDLRWLESEYTSVIIDFHDKFNTLLRENHESELRFLEVMRAEFEAQNPIVRDNYASRDSE